MAVHTFEPTHFHPTIGSHEPVLRIKDGDTVVTWCVDAGGHDREFKPVTPGGNPQTGPFYVEGAEPGDTLAVHFDRMWPNRHGRLHRQAGRAVGRRPRVRVELPYERNAGPRPSPPTEPHVDLWDARPREAARSGCTRRDRASRRCRSSRSSRCSAASASRRRAARRSRPRPPGSTAATWTTAASRQGVTVYFPVFVAGRAAARRRRPRDPGRRRDRRAPASRSRSTSSSRSSCSRARRPAGRAARTPTRSSPSATRARSTSACSTPRPS